MNFKILFSTTVFLTTVACSQSPLKPDVALGKWACIKHGLSDAGYPHTSDKYIAMFGVVAKLHEAEEERSVASAREDAALKSTVRTILAVGVCEEKNYPFATENEARQAQYWLSASRLKELNQDMYEHVFAISKGNVMAYHTDSNSWSDLPAERKRYYWNVFAAGTAPHSCAKPLADDKKSAVCTKIYSACGLSDASACSAPLSL